MSQTDRTQQSPARIAQAGADWGLASACAIVAHALLWWIGPASFVASLHPDTLQILFWGRDWQLGYPKHPPLASWLLNALILPTSAPIASTLALGAACVALTCALLWKAARLYGPPSTAALASLFYLASPVATYYAVQVNHNSLLTPLWAATLLFGLRYLEKKRLSDALLFGLFAGVGALTKYEIAFLLGAFAALIVWDAKLRPLLRSPALWLSAAVFLVVFAPHLVWLVAHPNQSLSYALDNRPIASGKDALASIGNAITGHLVLAIGPALGLLVLWAAGLRPTLRLARGRLAFCVALFPSLLLALASLALGQTIRQGWTIPFAPGVALGAALCIEIAAIRPTRRFLPLVVALSIVQLGAFYGLLAWRGARNDPVAAYDLDSRKLAADVQDFWRTHGSGPLECLVIDDGFVSAAPVLWLKDRPRVLQLDMPAWTGPQRARSCLAHGGVAVTLTARAMAPFAICPDGEQVRATAPIGAPGAGWTVHLAYVPPIDAPTACKSAGETR